MSNPQPFVFVLMPFGKQFEKIYSDGIKTACLDAGASCERVDEQKSDENILDRIYSQIAKADIIVADMTNRSPNVFYEVGYAHALGKRVILLIQDGGDISFDLIHYPHLIYRNDISYLKSELRKNIQWCIENPKDSFNNIKDPRVLAYLLEMNGLHNEIAEQTHFLTENNMVLEFLVKHYMANYTNALKDACHFQALPLPSEPRMKAAMQAISNTGQSICAVSVLKNDQWHKKGETSPYIKANIDAAKRCRVQRVFVVENKRELDKFENLIKLKKNAGIKLKYAIRKNLDKALNDYIDGAFSLVNILICDGRIMTLSKHNSKHDGSITLNPHKIALYKERFDLIWNCSHSL